jgi:hypothetical protein
MPIWKFCLSHTVFSIQVTYQCAPHVSVMGPSHLKHGFSDSFFSRGNENFEKVALMYCVRIKCPSKSWSNTLSLELYRWILYSKTYSWCGSQIVYSTTDIDTSTENYSLLWSIKFKTAPPEISLDIVTGEFRIIISVLGDSNNIES